MEPLKARFITRHFVQFTIKDDVLKMFALTTHRGIMTTF